MGDLTDELLRLLGQGQKIEAVRRYREATGCDLVEAKNAVEELVAQLETSPADAAEAAADDGDELSAEILELARNGGLIVAIKRYREATGCGLKEAKDAVEALCRRHHVVPQSKGCVGGAAALVLIFLATVAAVALR